MTIYKVDDYPNTHRVIRVTDGEGQFVFEAHSDSDAISAVVELNNGLAEINRRDRQLEMVKLHLLQFQAEAVKALGADNPKLVVNFVPADYETRKEE